MSTTAERESCSTNVVEPNSNTITPTPIATVETTTSEQELFEQLESLEHTIECLLTKEDIQLYFSKTRHNTHNIDRQPISSDITDLIKAPDTPYPIGLTISPSTFVNAMEVLSGHYISQSIMNIKKHIHGLNSHTKIRLRGCPFTKNRQLCFPDHLATLWLNEIMRESANLHDITFLEQLFPENPFLFNEYGTRLSDLGQGFSTFGLQSQLFDLNPELHTLASYATFRHLLKLPFFTDSTIQRYDPQRGQIYGFCSEPQFFEYAESLGAPLQHLKRIYIGGSNLRVLTQPALHCMQAAFCCATICIPGLRLDDVPAAITSFLKRHNINATNITEVIISTGIHHVQDIAYAQNQLKLYDIPTYESFRDSKSVKDLEQKFKIKFTVTPEIPQPIPVLITNTESRWWNITKAFLTK